MQYKLNKLMYKIYHQVHDIFNHYILYIYNTPGKVLYGYIFIFILLLFY